MKLQETVQSLISFVYNLRICDMSFSLSQQELKRLKNMWMWEDAGCISLQLMHPSTYNLIKPFLNKTNFKIKFDLPCTPVGTDSIAVCLHKFIVNIDQEEQ